MEQWTKEKSWEWYNKRPWIRGCNFISSDCCNRIDQWQEFGFEKRFATAKAELELARATGFNSIRIIIEYDVWKQQHSGFMKRFDRYLEAAYQLGIDAMVVLINGCSVPKSSYKQPVMGEQSVAWGYHGGKIKSPHCAKDEESYHPMDDPEIAEDYYKMAKEMMSEYKNDERVLAWNLYNEPGHGRKELSTTNRHIQRLFEIGWEIRPIAPLLVDVWQTIAPDVTKTSSCQMALDLSDVVSFHKYDNFETMVRAIEDLKSSGRPLIITEWLNRINHSTVEEMFPLFYLESIGCYNWGLVAGKYQTYEPWQMYWTFYERGETEKYDFTKWQHDLYRPSHFPYNPKEIELIKRFCKYADDAFAKRK